VSSSRLLEASSLLIAPGPGYADRSESEVRSYAWSFLDARGASNGIETEPLCSDGICRVTTKLLHIASDESSPAYLPATAPPIVFGCRANLFTHHPYGAHSRRLRRRLHPRPRSMMFLPAVRCPRKRWPRPAQSNWG